MTYVCGYMTRPTMFEIISADGEIIAYGCVFNSEKCIMEWTGENKLLMIWETNGYSEQNHESNNCIYLNVIHSLNAGK